MGCICNLLLKMLSLTNTVQHHCFIIIIFVLLYFLFKKLFIYLASLRLRCGTRDLCCDARSMWAQKLWFVRLVIPCRVESQVPDRGLNLHPLHCWADSLPPRKSQTVIVLFPSSFLLEKFIRVERIVQCTSISFPPSLSDC